MLYIIQQAHDKNLRQALRLAQKDDSIVLFDEGVYSLLKAQDLQTPCPIFAISSHATARGITLPDNIQSIDMAGFSKMVFEHQSNVSFY